MIERQDRQKADQEEAKAMGLALDSSVVQRMRHSKNVIFGSQFINDLTELIPSAHLTQDQNVHEQSLLRQ
jgi:hypothetical protein